MESILHRLAIDLCEHKSESNRPCDTCLAKAAVFTQSLATEARMNGYVFTGKWLGEIAAQNL